jgi:hypothetical protein
MADDAASTITGALFNSTKALIEGAASGFLKDHPEVESFLLTSFGRLGKAQLLRWIETDPAKLADLQGQIDDEKEAITEETDAVLKDIEDDAAPLVVQILKTAFSIFVASGSLAVKMIK